MTSILNLRPVGSAQGETAKSDVLASHLWPNHNDRSKYRLEARRLNTIHQVDRDQLVKEVRRWKRDYSDPDYRQQAIGPTTTGWWATGKELKGVKKQAALLEKLGMTAFYEDCKRLTAHHAVRGRAYLTHDDDPDVAPFVDVNLQLVVTASVRDGTYSVKGLYVSHKSADSGAFGSLLYCGSPSWPRVLQTIWSPPAAGEVLESYLIDVPVIEGEFSLDDEQTLIEYAKDTYGCHICPQMSVRKAYPLAPEIVAWVSKIDDPTHPLFEMHKVAPGQILSNWESTRDARRKMAGEERAEWARVTMHGMSRAQWAAKCFAGRGACKSTNGQGMKGAAKKRHAMKSVAGMKKYSHLPAKAKARAMSEAKKRGYAAAKNKPCRCGSMTHNRMSHRECRFYGMVLTDREKKKGKIRTVPYFNQPRCYECP